MLGIPKHQPRQHTEWRQRGHPNSRFEQTRPPTVRSEHDQEQGRPEKPGEIVEKQSAARAQSRRTPPRQRRRVQSAPRAGQKSEREHDQRQGAGRCNRCRIEDRQQVEQHGRGPARPRTGQPGDEEIHGRRGQSGEHRPQQRCSERTRAGPPRPERGAHSGCARSVEISDRRRVAAQREISSRGCHFLRGEPDPSQHGEQRQDTKGEHARIHAVVMSRGCLAASTGTRRGASLRHNHE